MAGELFLLQLASPFALRAAGAAKERPSMPETLDHKTIHQQNHEGDFESVTASLEKFMQRNRSCSHTDSLFIAKLVDMYVSGEIDRTFEQVREEFIARGSDRRLSDPSEWEGSRRFPPERTRYGYWKVNMHGNVQAASGATLRDASAARVVRDVPFVDAGSPDTTVSAGTAAGAHSYPQPAIYPEQLRMADANGITITAEVSVTVKLNRPFADAGSDRTAPPGTQVRLQGNGRDTLHFRGLVAWGGAAAIVHANAYVAATGQGAYCKVRSWSGTVDLTAGISCFTMAGLAAGRPAITLCNSPAWAA
jgi:hypothetical protein